METALFYYHYSDRNPAEWNITVDKNVSRNRTKIDYPFVKAYRVEPYLVPLGEIKGSIDFVDVRIYDRDRTICDVLRNMSRTLQRFRKSMRRSWRSRVWLRSPSGAISPR